ncbi:MAG: dTDP-4-dehydrorhamnose 3,5-epimerase [Bacteroidota bacterium]
MNLQPTTIPGCVLVVPEWHEDERGGFARTWDRAECARLGMASGVDQCSVSHNRQRGTLRGMHYQVAPHEEAKLVRCTRGAVYDVCLDLREGSKTRGQWVGAELTEENGHALYVPTGCAHGFLTLTDDAEVFYMIAGRYAPEAARGVRYDDPTFGIEWPGEVRVIKERDASYPDWAG